MIKLKITAVMTYKKPVIIKPLHGTKMYKANRRVPIRKEPMANNVENEI